MCQNQILNILKYFSDDGEKDSFKWDQTGDTERVTCSMNNILPSPKADFMFSMREPLWPAHTSRKGIGHK